MAVKQIQTKLGNHWQWLLAIIFGLAGFGLILAPSWAALTPSPAAVDTQVKVKFNAFKSTSVQTPMTVRQTKVQQKTSDAGKRVDLSALSLIFMY